MGEGGETGADHARGQLLQEGHGGKPALTSLSPVVSMMF